MSDATPTAQDRLMEVLPSLEFTGIQVMELRGRRCDYVSEGNGSNEEALPEVEGTQMAVNVLQAEEELIVRITGGATTDKVQVDVTIDGRFSKSVPDDIDGPTLGLFVEKVAIMSIYPFIRQAVHDMSSRLGAPATLHLLRAGQIQVTDDEDESREAPQIGVDS